MNSKEMIVGLDTSATADVLMINTPLRNYGDRPKDDYEVLPPLGLGTLLTELSLVRHNVGLLDAEEGGVPLAKINEAIYKTSPRIVGMNVLTPTREVGMQIAQHIDEDTVLVIGGPHASAMPERTIQEFSKIHRNTVLLKGHASESIKMLAEGESLDTIGGAYWVDENGNIQVSPALPTTRHFNESPMIDRRYLANDPSIDSKTGKLEARVMASLNCPFDCSFCQGARSSQHLATQHRSAEKVGAEINYLVQKFGVSAIRFVDDLFLSSEKRAFSILGQLDQIGVGNLTWDATGRANILSKFSVESLRKLKQSGMHESAIGIESGSARLRERINKKVTLEQIQHSIELLTGVGIKVKGYFIVGLPSESKVETYETINLAKRLSASFNGAFRTSIFNFRPYPGTQEWQRLIEAGYTEDALLQMDAHGKGERSKHTVTSANQFAEYTPDELDQIISEFSNEIRVN